ncbi:MAG: hypothetical protein Q9215_004123 [Flavoplaca cf. flavocitrina]
MSETATRPSWLQLVLSLCLLLIPTASAPLLAGELVHISSTPSPGSGSPTIAQPGLSATLPPPGFAIRVSGGSKPIHNHDVFKLSVKALATFAVNSFDRSYRANVLQLHKDAKIALALGGPGTNFLANYTIWGITLATKYMVDQHSFRNWRFQLYWQQNYVGQIWYVNGHQISTPSAIDALRTSGQEVLWQTNNTTTQPEIANLGAAPNIRIAPIQGPALTLNEVMMTIISGLSDLAPHNKDQRVQNTRFITNFAPYRGRIDIGFSWPPQLSPPWYTYSFLIQLLEGLAGWFFANCPSGTSCLPVEISMRQPDGGPVLGQGQFSI